jgi:cytidylate kinase
MCKRSAKHMADATTRGRLERIVRREGTRQERNLGTVAEIEVGKPERAPANFQPDVTEATVSVTGN